MAHDVKDYTVTKLASVNDVRNGNRFYHMYARVYGVWSSNQNNISYMDWCDANGSNSHRNPWSAQSVFSSVNDSSLRGHKDNAIAQPTFPPGTRFLLNSYKIFEGLRLADNKIEWRIQGQTKLFGVETWLDEGIQETIDDGRLKVISTPITTPITAKQPSGPCTKTTESGFPCELMAPHTGRDCAVVKSVNPLHAPKGASADEINLLAQPNGLNRALVAGYKLDGYTNPINDFVTLSEAAIHEAALGPWKPRKKRD